MTRKQLMDVLKGIPMDTPVVICKTDTWGDKGYFEVEVENNTGFIILNEGEETSLTPKMPEWAKELYTHLRDEEEACDDGLAEFAKALNTAGVSPGNPPVALLEKWKHSWKDYIQYSDEKETLRRLIPEGWVPAINKIIVDMIWSGDW